MIVIAAIARANLIRLVSDRSNLFWVAGLPLLIVFALGMAIGDDVTHYRLGVADPHPDAASRAVAHQMDQARGVDLRTYDNRTALRDDVARRVLDGGWAVSPLDQGAEYTWYPPLSGDAVALQGWLSSAVERAAIHDQVVAAVTEQTGTGRARAERAVTAAEQRLTPVAVSSVSVGEARFSAASLNAVLAAGELTLFIFLTSATGAGALLASRQLGITRRMRAAPVPVLTIIAGEALGRFLIAFAQAGIVFFGCMWLFDVDWRAPLAVWLLCIGMCLIGTGVAMVLGALGSSEQQVNAIGVLVSLVFGALGGSMTPLEFFPDTLRRFAFWTPHAWMNDALWRILVDGAGLAEVWPSVAVLFAEGVVMVGVASLALGRSLR